MKHFRLITLMVFALLLSVGLFAQRGRGHHNRGHNNIRYNSNRHYYNNHLSVRVMPRYHYYPTYRSYNRPVPIYRPVYNSRRSYVHFGPVFGLRINLLPFGYSRIYVGPNPYYYYEGVYYRPYANGGYQVVAPPLHATVKNLPANARVTVIDGQKYYQVGGTFYQEEITEKNKLRYRVVGTDGVLNTGYNQEEDLHAMDDEIPALGSRYDELPVDSKVQVINQQKYFVTTNGIYYKEIIEGDRVRYEVTTIE